MDAGDHGQPSTTYPAFPIDAVSILNQGGMVDHTPVVVTVTWSGDPDEATYQAYGDKIGASQYWSAINSEYGVGPITSGAANHVSIKTAPPAMMSDSDIDTFVETNAGTNGWPAATPETIYAVYISPSTTFTFGSGTMAQDACSTGVFGYHSQSQNKNTVYAVMLHCSQFSQADVLSTASHEFNEAATDPLPYTATAYTGFDAAHMSFEFFNGYADELGDACQNFLSSEFTTTEPNFAYPAQRQWSNMAQAAGHNACQPAADEGPYFNVTLFPAQEQTIHADLTSQGLTANEASKGFIVTLNQPTTFQVGFISDADTGGPWTLSANVPAQTYLSDQNGNAIANGTGTVTIDKTSGENGEKAYVTVTPTTMGPTGTLYFELTSKGTAPANDAGPTPAHYMPILVSTK
jgi:hypothetical protein